MAVSYSEDSINLFKQPARFLVAGYSNSGKSELINKIIIKYHEVFKRIIICGVKEHALEANDVIEPKLKLSLDIIDPLQDEDTYDKRGTLFVLDDVYAEAVKNKLVVDAFTRGRHSGLSVILITQNLYMSGKHARDISLNCSHFLLLRQRDLSQIELLGRQIFGPTRARAFADIYKAAVYSRSYGYLLVDLSINTPEALQFRSNIVDEGPYERVFQW